MKGMYEEEGERKGRIKRRHSKLGVKDMKMEKFN
jgi:hypothetical protein